MMQNAASYGDGEKHTDIFSDGFNAVELFRQPAGGPGRQGR